MTKQANAADLEALAQRCEQATGPDANLECDIWRAVECREATCPRYTASVDAALTLVPEGIIESGIWWPDPKCELVLSGETVSGEAATLALAITAAALRAHAAKEVA